MSRKDYYDLDVWQEAKELSLEVYKLTSQFPTKEQFALTSQMRRSTISILYNDLTLIDSDTLNQLLEKITTCKKKLINGFAKYYKQLSDNK